MNNIIVTNFGLNNDLPKVMRDAFRAARRIRKLTQADIAKRYGTTQSTIARFEKSPEHVVVKNWLKLIACTGAKTNFHISVEVEELV